MLAQFLAFIVRLFTPESKIVDMYQRLTQTLEQRIAHLEERLDACERTHTADQNAIRELRDANNTMHDNMLKQNQVINELRRTVENLQQKLAEAGLGS